MAAKGLKRSAALSKARVADDGQPGLQVTEVCPLLPDVVWRVRMARVAGAAAGCLLSLAVMVLFVSMPLSGGNEAAEGQ